MGLFDFVKEAGEKLFGNTSAQAASAPDAAAANATATSPPNDSTLPGKCHRRIHHRPGRKGENPDILSPWFFWQSAES